MLLVALLPLMSPGSAFSFDEGAYALQVQALDEGGWAFDYRAGAYDPEGRFFPVVLSDRGSQGFFPYVKHPALPLALWGSSRLLGTALGLHLPAMAGTVAAAVAAGLLAAEVDRRLARAAFWLAAASPVLVNGWMLWGHSLSAAFGGLALVAAVRIARRGITAAGAVALGAALAAGVLVRAEGLLFALAVGLGLGAAVSVIGLCSFYPARRGKAHKRRGWTGWAGWAAVAPFACAVVPAAAAAAAERAWIHAIAGDVRTISGLRGAGTPYIAGRLTGAWHELAGGHYGRSVASIPVMVAGVVVVVVGLRALGGGRRRDLTVAAGVVVALVGLRAVLFADDAVTGLFAAWPLALLGLLATRWRTAGAEVRLLGLVVALYAAAVLATQYPEGGGLEWGGRFFSAVVPALAAVAVAALATRPGAVGPRGRAVGRPLVAIAGSFALLGVVCVAWQRADHERVAAAIARHPAAVTVTTVESLPRLAWTTHRRLSWMLARPADLAALVEHLRASGVPSVAVIASERQVSGPWPYPDRQVAREPSLNSRGAGLVVLSG